MLSPIASAKRRKKLVAAAARSRESNLGMKAAIALIVIYNLVGLADIASTALALGVGTGDEANPIVAAAMSTFGYGWIFAKLAVQVLISAMVLWYPHWIVLGFFSAAIAGNAFIVASNFHIAGVF